VLTEIYPTRISRFTRFSRITSTRTYPVLPTQSILLYPIRIARFTRFSRITSTRAYLVLPTQSMQLYPTRIARFTRITRTRSYLVLPTRALRLSASAESTATHSEHAALSNQIHQNHQNQRAETNIEASQISGALTSAVARREVRATSQHYVLQL